MRFIATGTLTGEELLRANSTVYETKEKTLASRYQICDYRGVEKVEVTTEDVKLLAERDQLAAAINPNIVIAVVGDTDLFLALARMWQAHTMDAPFVTKIFRSMDEAERWVAESLKAAS